MDAYTPDLWGERRPLVCLSHGLGVDTNALSVLLNEHPDFDRYRPDHIIHVDTGAELPHVHAVSLPAMQAYHEGWGQRIEVIRCDDPRYQTPSKLVPFRKRVNELDDRRRGGWRLGGRHKVLVGIAADEAARCGGMVSYVSPDAPYLEVRYPLVELGWTRRMCYELLRGLGLPALKSGCFCCPFQPLLWFWALREVYPELHALGGDGGEGTGAQSEAAAHAQAALGRGDTGVGPRLLAPARRAARPARGARGHV